MRILLDPDNMVATGWRVTASSLGTMAEHDDREGLVTILLREVEGRLEFEVPAPESAVDGWFMTHLFDVLTENTTTYKIV